MFNVFVVTGKSSAAGPQRGPTHLDVVDNFLLPFQIVVGIHHPGKRRNLTSFDGHRRTNGHKCLFRSDDFSDSAGGFESVFEQFFGRSRNARGPRQAAPPPPLAHGQDLTHNISLPFIKAALGTQATIKLKTVGGPSAGKLQALDVKIPPGVADGSKIRIRGKGRPSSAGAPPGDLYLKVSVQPHPYFWREARNIYVELPVSFAEAALGTKLGVPTLHGTTSVTVPPGVSSGQKLRLKGKGVPAAGSNAQPGHQYVVIKIVSPPKLTPEAEKLLKQFQQETNFKPERFK